MVGLIFMRFVGLVNVFIPSHLTDSTAERLFKDGVAQMNKVCPKMLDSETRADSITVGGEKTIVYWFTLPCRLQAELNIPMMKQFLTAQIINDIKTSDAMRPLRDNNVTFLYRYFDKTHVEILDIEATPNDYE